MSSDFSKNEFKPRIIMKRFALLPIWKERIEHAEQHARDLDKNWLSIELVKFGKKKMPLCDCDHSQVIICEDTDSTQEIFVCVNCKSRLLVEPQKLRDLAKFC